MGHGGTGKPTPPFLPTKHQFRPGILAPPKPAKEPTTMSVREAAIAHIVRSLKEAHNGRAPMDPEVEKIRGFSTPMMRRFFSNFLHGEDRIHYLEVGAYCGGTFCAAVSNNPNVTAQVFEDFSQPFDIPDVKEQFTRNLAEFGKGWVHEEDFFKAHLVAMEPVDVFFYDGNHDEQWQSKALPHVFDKLADTFIFLVDDIAWETVRAGTKAGFAALKDRMEIIHHWELFGKTKNDDRDWHNGLGVWLCRKRERFPTFLHNGDIGDVIASLPVIRHLGGGKVVFTQGRNPRPFAAGAKALENLLLAQDYIKAVEWKKTPGIPDYDFTMFRYNQKRDNRSLAHEQSSHIGVTNPDMRPWLAAMPSPISKGRVIVSRSARYQNKAFPWKKVGEHYGEKLAFIGHEDEHRALQAELGRRLERYVVRDFMDIAELIAGSELFIGNQSSPCWVAMALGHPLIQETNPHIKNSMVRRPNAQFVDKGLVIFP